MSLVFADTSYFLSLLNTKDEHHASAFKWSQRSGTKLLLTEFILLELGNALSTSKSRYQFVGLVYQLRNDDDVTLVELSTDLMKQGELLFASRSDKDWSLTDCISFVTMRQYRVNEALTSDHHFSQAGFRVLL